ncbi:MAG: tRNA (adenosine(37)-N6)-threonylcarbamoyltransferase complex dimerization subunit type 1 TsaB [Candidatus Gastranaerophilales bacterium]|nr:tRNA (adenosine(37)-N6)-threonylcarbamoyltransferase complex dimerization subunit type 1 TsaB [Candidatus Gastranaerophilales bacterium]
MNILTIDTTLNKLYLTLGSDDFFDSKTIESDEQKYHSAYIASAIVELLKKHKIMTQNIDAIAVNIGPGSFTGIRVGMTMARVIAQAHNIKTIGVCSLEVLSKLNKSDKDTLVLMDARKSKTYAAKFGSENTTPVALPLEEALSIAQSGKYYIVADKNMTNFLAQNSIIALNYEDAGENLGKCLFDIAKDKLSQDDDFNWAKLKPLYIQPPPISMPKK